MRDKLARLKFTGDELRSIPSVHASFLVASSLAINDIAIFQKTFILALNAHRVSQAGASVDAAKEQALTQVSVIQRTLGAKLREYLYLVGQYKATCEKRKDETMTAFLQNANQVCQTLKSSTAYELADWYRNQVTNHYILQSSEKLLKHLPNDGDYSLLLHEKDGNSSYPLGENALHQKFAGKTQEEVQAAVGGYLDWILQASRDTLHLHHQYCFHLLERFFPHKTADEEAVEVDDHLVADLETACLPLYWNLTAVSGHEQ